ncbi:MAG: phosphotransacetylase family protein [Cyanothece sp. SIO1E1]|nr:phosphotransacetylase family protein [Cyanothece sp. SIO1E1]
MPESTKYLLIGSTEAYSGKSAIILGLAHQLQTQGLDIGYGKPIGTCVSESQIDQKDEDVRFVAQTLDLPENRIKPTVLCLDEETLKKRISGTDETQYRQHLEQYLQHPCGDLVLLEGPGSLEEGSLFDLSLLRVAQLVNADVVLVARFQSVLVVDALLSAQQKLGDCLAGVLINDVPGDQLDNVNTHVKPFLEQHGIPVLGILPRHNVLRSVSVGELVHQLNAEVLCCHDRLDLMVESLTIGAMNVNSALKYFRKANHMAVVTGGDRTDIQLAALETSTHCLILTGHIPPSPAILSRAEDLEVPILSVDLDTLTTVEIIDRAFDQARLHELVKVECICDLMQAHCDIERLMADLGLKPATVVQ